MNILFDFWKKPLKKNCLYIILIYFLNLLGEIQRKRTGQS